MTLNSFGVTTPSLSIVDGFSFQLYFCFLGGDRCLLRIVSHCLSSSHSDSLTDWFFFLSFLLKKHHVRTSRITFISYLVVVTLFEESLGSQSYSSADIRRETIF